MDDYVNKFQAHFHGLEGDHGDKLERLHQPYSRAFNQVKSTSSFFEMARPAVTQFRQQQHQIYRPPPQCFRQAPQALNPSLYDDRDNKVLDGYGKHPNYVSRTPESLESPDRALLAEPRSQLQWTTNDRTGTIAPGRLSLPGHTAPFTPTLNLEDNSFERRRKSTSKLKLLGNGKRTLR